MDINSTVDSAETRQTSHFELRTRSLLNLTFGFLIFLLPIRPIQGADAYLKSLEDRIAALEAEVNVNQADSKGKAETATPKIPVYVVPKSKFVQELRIRGRIQAQYGYSWGDGYQDPGHGSYSTFEMRRVRLGVEGKLTNDFRFMVELEVACGPGVGLVDTWVQYEGNELFKPKLGKYKPTFGFEETASSIRLKTVERTRAANAYATYEIVGASVEGEYGMLKYTLGIFNALPGGATAPLSDANLLGNGNQDYLYNGSVALNLERVVHFPLELRADYMNFTTNPNVNQVNTMNLQQNFNLSLNATYGRFSLLTEWYAGFNSNADQANLSKVRSDGEYAWAISVEPSFFIIPEKLQYVFRYEYGSAGFITSGLPTSGRGPQPQASRVRYESKLPGAGAGPLSYFALYNGLNWLINGDDLKLMFGHYYSEQQGTPGGGKASNRVAQTVYGAVRMSF